MSPECIAWSIDNDETLRANYSSIIMNGNATLSREKAKAASMVVVDAEAVYQHEGWMEAFNKTIQHSSKKWWLCSHHQKHMHGKSGGKERHVRSLSSEREGIEIVGGEERGLERRLDHSKWQIVFQKEIAYMLRSCIQLRA
jgi:hypothetical protein